MRRCSTCEIKRSEIGSIMLERKLNMLPLSETKMKGNDDCKFVSVVGRVSRIVNGLLLKLL